MSDLSKYETVFGGAENNEDFENKLFNFVKSPDARRYFTGGSIYAGGYDDVDSDDEDMFDGGEPDENNPVHKNPDVNEETDLVYRGSEPQTEPQTELQTELQPDLVHRENDVPDNTQNKLQNDAQDDVLVYHNTTGAGEEQKNVQENQFDFIQRGIEPPTRASN